MSGWETWIIVGAVVLATAYLARLATRGNKKKGGCGHSCGCGKKPQGS